MSISLSKRVYELDLECSYERHVLARLADRINDKTGVCWPSVSTIAREVCCSPRTVQGAMKKLEKRGLLIVERNAGPKGCNLYRLTLPPAQDAPLNVVRPSTSHSHPQQVRAQGPAQDAHEPKKNQNKTRQGPALSDEDALVVEAIKQGKHFLLTRVSANKARALVSEGHVTSEECKAVRLL